MVDVAEIAPPDKVRYVKNVLLTEVQHRLPKWRTRFNSLVQAEVAQRCPPPYRPLVRPTTYIRIWAEGTKIVVEVSASTRTIPISLTSVENEYLDEILGELRQIAEAVVWKLREKVMV